MARGKRDLRVGETDRSCGALLLYVNHVVRPEDNNVIERLVDFAENELSYLPTRTHALPLITYLAFPGKKISKQHIDEVNQILRKRRYEQWKEDRQQILWNKFQNLLSFVIWPSQTRLLSPKDLETFTRQRDVSLSSNEYAGYFQSNKLNRFIQYESGLEYDFLQSLEKFDQVIFYQEQPFKISYEFENTKHVYYPDILFVLQSGQGIVVEIKPVFKMALQVNLKKWAALKNFCSENGLGLLITDGRLAIQQVQHFKINPNFAADILLALERGALSWREYKCIRDKYKVTRGDLLALVLKHRLVWHLNPFKLEVPT
jgi:hypothetical protein